MAAWVLLVGQRSSETLRAASSAHSAGSSTATPPCAMRAGCTSSARRTCAAPPHSPACNVMASPPARAMSNASLKVSGSGKAASRPARSNATTPRCCAATAAAARCRFSSSECERRAVTIRRTSVPVAVAARRAPAATAAITCDCVSPFAVWRCGPHRISR